MYLCSVPLRLDSEELGSDVAARTPETYGNLTGPGAVLMMGMLCNSVDVDDDRDDVMDLPDLGLSANQFQKYL